MGHINFFSHVKKYNNKSLYLEGKVCSSVYQSFKKQEFNFCVDSFSFSSDFKYRRNISGKILLRTKIFPQFSYGDYIKLNCFLESVEPFSGFAYDRYLARFDIYSICNYPDILQYEKNNSASIWRYIFDFKKHLTNIFRKNLDEDQSSILEAMLLGSKKVISDNLYEIFSKTGLSHMIAISGMHIGILSVMILNFFLSLGFSRKKVFYFVVLFLFFYLALIGFPASAMRASLMGFFLFWSIYLGRLNKANHTFVLVISIILFINPKLLRDDIGFQLSVGACLGLTYFLPLFEKIFDIFTENIKSKNENLGIFTERFLKVLFLIFAASFSAQILSLPIIINNFHAISSVSMISNLLVIWILPFLIVASLVAILFSIFLPIFSFMFFLVVRFLLSYIVFIANFLASFSWVYIEVNNFSLVYVFFYYVLIFILFLELKKITEKYS